MGWAVRQAYKNDPPSSNLDQWVGEVLRVSLTAKQINIVNSIIYDNMTCGEAIYSEYKNAMPQVVEDYMAEIGEIIERYGGTTACENKLTLLHVQYYKAAESEYKQLITWR